ncbi:MAG: hypothetical protein KatS3mg095_0907 [Candidatus Parcubacteria bacterium]|nr:MAG: hypothetical protein KatS3mg095_0907 [Candidatus Parcubacteria bacterium]
MAQNYREKFYGILEGMFMGDMYQKFIGKLIKNLLWW